MSVPQIEVSERVDGTGETCGPGTHCKNDSMGAGWGRGNDEKRVWRVVMI